MMTQLLSQGNWGLAIHATQGRTCLVYIGSGAASSEGQRMGK